MVSLPSRERELKLLLLGGYLAKIVSLPSRERELKLDLARKSHHQLESLPSRERELKHYDEPPSKGHPTVAPFTGA